MARTCARIDMRHSPRTYAVIHARSDAIASTQPVPHTVVLSFSSRGAETKSTRREQTSVET